MGDAKKQDVEEIVIRDKKGNERGFFGFDKETVCFRLCDKQGSVRAMLEVEADGQVEAVFADLKAAPDPGSGAWEFAGIRMVCRPDGEAEVSIKTPIGDLLCLNVSPERGPEIVFFKPGQKPVVINSDGVRIMVETAMKHSQAAKGRDN